MDLALFCCATDSQSLVKTRDFLLPMNKKTGGYYEKEISRSVHGGSFVSKYAGRLCRSSRAERTGGSGRRDNTGGG